MIPGHLCLCFKVLVDLILARDIGLGLGEQQLYINGLSETSLDQQGRNHMTEHFQYDCL